MTTPDTTTAEGLAPVPTDDTAPAADAHADPTAEGYAAEQEMTDTGTDDGGDIGKARKDAAKYRTRLRDTEAERDNLRDQLAAQRRAVIDWRAANSPNGSVDPALLDAAGIDVDALVDADTGQLDMAAVDTFISETATRFNVVKGFTPNRAQGYSGAPAAVPSLADAFRPR